MAKKKPRSAHYLALIDRSLDYLLAQQDLASDPPGMLGGNLNAGVFMAHAGLWAYQQAASRYHRNPLIIERAKLALDCRTGQPALMARDFFAPLPVLEVVAGLKEIGEKTEERWPRVAIEILEEQGRGSLHDEVGHWSDWDTFYAAAAALAARLTGDAKWLSKASEHIQVLRANAVGVDGFLHWTTPYENWNPTANYEGLIMANLARYFQLTSDPDAGWLLDQTAEYYLHYVEPSGLTDFTPSIFPKQYHENKKDSYCFAAAACEFLASRRGDGRYARVAELMQGNLQRMQKTDGGIDMKPWPVAAFAHSVGLQALATGYLRYAAGWCAGGKSRDLPDGYVRRHATLHGFKARYGDFSYSVGCNESQISLAGAARGLGTLAEGVFALVEDGDGKLYGQVGPFWREYACGDGEVMASTSFYHPILIKVGAGRQPTSPWLIRQSFIAAGDTLIGMITFQAPQGVEDTLPSGAAPAKVGASPAPATTGAGASPAPAKAIVDIHLGPAGSELAWGGERIQGGTLVQPENPKALELGVVAPGGWIHYGGLGLRLLDFFGDGAAVRLWDGVKGEMLHRSSADQQWDFNTVISNDAIIEFSAAASSGTAGGHCGLLFSLSPCKSPEEAVVQWKSSRVRLLPTSFKTRRHIAFSQGAAEYVAVVTHEPDLRTVPLELELPSDGTRQVSVHAYLDAPPIQERTVTGRTVNLRLLGVSPVLLVRIAREGG